MRKAVVIISGGIDSTGAAAYVKKIGHELYLMTFYYGQRAKKEVEVARLLAGYLGAAEHRVIDIGFMKQLYGSSNVLTDEAKKMPSVFQPNIIVPVRNAVFLTIATAWAFSIGAETVAYGAHLTDRPYPDCRPGFAKALAESLNLGDIDAIQAKHHPPIKIWSPAIQGLEKWQMLKTSYGVLGDRVYETWSCYLDGKIHCGACESCKNRKKAFLQAEIEDRTPYTRK